jgi:hypothetical protein
MNNPEPFAFLIAVHKRASRKCGELPTRRAAIESWRPPARRLNQTWPVFAEFPKLPGPRRNAFAQDHAKAGSRNYQLEAH